MRFATLASMFATLVASALACLILLPYAAHAATETGHFTAPAAGATVTTGTPATVKATVGDTCTATLTVRTPDNRKEPIATERGNATCTGTYTITGTFTPAAPGTYTITLTGTDTLAEQTVTATNPAPTPTPTPTVTTTATVTATPTPTPTVTTTATVTATPKPKATTPKPTTPKPTTAKPTTAKPTTASKPRPTITITDHAPAPYNGTAKQPAVVNNLAPTDDDDRLTLTDEPTPATPVITVTAQPDLAAILAYRNMSASDAGSGSAITAILATLLVIAALGGGIALIWHILRKRGRHH
ncbi:hypothetical protein [Nonomuraea glycinis]|uniref:hypothetical protein n=1 Tax=Nonomuraea glycinis TaxID=2047744 RepID=UPI0033BA3EAA